MANAIGPLVAIVSTFSQASVEAKVAIPMWVLLIGVMIGIGVIIIWAKTNKYGWSKITRLNAPRSYCVALASAITVLIATTLGLPVSSTHIAIGAIFGVGFLREIIENPAKRRLKPGHKLNVTAEDAFDNINARLSRKLVRRQFVYSINSGVGYHRACVIGMALFFFALQYLI